MEEVNIDHRIEEEESVPSCFQEYSRRIEVIEGFPIV
jgi:hypothetical protein